MTNNLRAVGDFFERIFNVLIVYNLVISFSAAVLTYGISIHFNIGSPETYAIINFLLVFAVYTLQRLADGADIAISSTYARHNTIILILTSAVALISASVLTWKIFHFNQITLLFGLFFTFICYWYTMPVFGVKLREIPGLKIFSIACTWAFACAVFPLANEGINLATCTEFFGLIIIYFIAITLPFDVRDLNVDSFNQSTIPQLIGVSRTKIVGVVLLVIFLLGNLFFTIIQGDNLLFYVAVIIQIILLMITSTKRGNLFYGLIDFFIVLLGFAYCI